MKKIFLAAVIAIASGVGSAKAQCWNGRCYGVHQETFEAKLEIKVKLFHTFTGFNQPWQFGLPAGTVILSVTDCKTGEKRVFAEGADGEQQPEYANVFRPAPTFTDSPDNDALFIGTCEADRKPELLPPAPQNKKGERE